MKKILLGLVFTMFAMQVNAATFDFLAIANTGEYGAPSISFTEGGITVTATGTDATGSNQYNAYLDSGDAGLGVCQALNGTQQCAEPSDDNVTSGEILSLVFDRVVSLSGITFLNGSHNLAFNGGVDITVDGVSRPTDSLLNIFPDTLVGTTFLFANNNTVLGDQQQFYISALTAETPLPAAVWLFGSALMGLFGVSRRKSSAVAA